MYTENRARSASIVMRMFSLSKLITLLISNKKNSTISLKVDFFFKLETVELVRLETVELNVFPGKISNDLSKLKHFKKMFKKRQ